MSEEEYFDYLKLCAEITDKLDNTAEYESWLLVQDYVDYEHRELIRLNNIIKEVREFVDEIISSTKGVINDYMYHEEHNKHLIELLKEDVVMYKHILEILDKGE